MKSSVRKTILDRISVRTFDKTGHPEGKIEELLVWVNGEMKLPFEHNFRVGSVALSDLKNKKVRPGGYGVFSGIQHLLVGLMPDPTADLCWFGYYFEKILLKATELGLSTCWIAGDLDRIGLAATLGFGPEAFVPAVLPIGFAAAKPGLYEQVARLAIKPRTRKPYEELFFYQGFDRPLMRQQAAGYFQALEMVRIAPSASNKQPWRILMQEDGFDFFLLRTAGYKEKLGFDIQKLDLGIAMCHFELSALELGFRGIWVDAPPEEYEANDDLVYIRSFRKVV